METEEIIEILSKLHKDHSRDPMVLCCATLHDFNLNDPKVVNYPKLQFRLWQLVIEPSLKEC